MAKHGRKYTASAEKLDRKRNYELEEAVKLMKEMRFAKFNESVDVDVLLGVDPRNADQQVRGSVVLPHGTGKSVRVAVFAKGDSAVEATEAGAEFVGAEDLVEKIKGGWTDFDAAVATPDMMRVVSQVGKILGPRGLMPNPKAGTVTPKVGDVVRELKAGKVEYRLDRNAIIHCSIGKAEFSDEQIVENARALLDAVIRAKPSAAKGNYVKSISICTTMSPGVGVHYLGPNV